MILVTPRWFRTLVVTFSSTYFLQKDQFLFLLYFSEDLFPFCNNYLFHFYEKDFEILSTSSKIDLFFNEVLFSEHTSLVLFVF